MSQCGHATSLSEANGAEAPANDFITFEDRLSDSPFVERVWRCRSDRAGNFLSVAACNFEMCFTRLQGRAFLTLRGPEMQATAAECPGEGEWLAIRFRPGVFLPRRPPSTLANRNDLTVPNAGSRSFWWNGSALEYPDFENAEAFVARLTRSGELVRDPIVGEVLRRQPATLSLRSAQRHFLRATGMTYTGFRQIERARYATNLLKQGVSILDTVHIAGYFDQAHLTRSLRRLIGETPVQIRKGERQLSFLYKNEPPL